MFCNLNGHSTVIISCTTQNYYKGSKNIMGERKTTSHLSYGLCTNVMLMEGIQYDSIYVRII